MTIRIKKRKQSVPDKFGEIRLERVGVQEEDRDIWFRRKLSHMVFDPILQVILLLASKFKIVLPECFNQSCLDLIKFEKLSHKTQCRDIH